MVGTLKVAVFAGLILAALGCSEKKTTKEVQEEKILATPAEIVSRMHQMTNDIFVLEKQKGFCGDRPRVAAEKSNVFVRLLLGYC